MTGGAIERRRLRRARLRSFRVTPRSYQACWGRTYIRATMFALGYRSVTDPRGNVAPRVAPAAERGRPASGRVDVRHVVHIAPLRAGRGRAGAWRRESSSACRRAIAAVASSWFHGRPWGWPASMASRV